jgi:hypothetical protein
MRTNLRSFSCIESVRGKVKHYEGGEAAELMSNTNWLKFVNDCQVIRRDTIYFDFLDVKTT